MPDSKFYFRGGKCKTKIQPTKGKYLQNLQAVNVTVYMLTHELFLKIQGFVYSSCFIVKCLSKNIRSTSTAFFMIQVQWFNFFYRNFV